MIYYDIIVIGAGHAGIEAATAAARMGCKIALLTLSKNKVGHMPCNPAVGGIGKGHIVFEISALGGTMPQLCSKSYLQANMLNQSKGPAVQGLRLQIDKAEYAKEALNFIQNSENIDLIEEIGDELLFNENKEIIGIKTVSQKIYNCKNIIITTGTFLNGLIHIGLKNFSGGRANEQSITGLAQSMKSLNLNIGRLKTGTPPRLLRSSLNFDFMEEQGSHILKYLFELDSKKVVHKKSCYMTRTNKNTHDIIRENADLSPIYRKEICGIAPRYCPSIEDKLLRFSEKDSHNIFVEPEGLLSEEIYPNGLSTSLPLEVQEKFIRSISGFENAIITQPGYAIEYDFVFPNQLKHTLELKEYKGLFLAGQINGTTGYEEAAGQGLIAGINAACRSLNLPDFILNREESYIGIMVDDLVTLSIDEPYRMFTSRAERRLIIRQDNVFYRMYEKAYKYNLIKKYVFEKIDLEYKNIEFIKNDLLKNEKKRVKLFQEISTGNENLIKEKINSIYNLNDRQRDYLFSEILYYPYYEKEMKEVKKISEYRELTIRDDFNYMDIPGLSKELQQKLSLQRPINIAQATLIKGMTPAAISLLIFKIREFNK